jgi:hypothetical protein
METVAERPAALDVHKQHVIACVRVPAAGGREQHIAEFKTTVAGQVEYGLIAEQVARLYPSLVQYEPNGKPGGVYYEELPVLLLAQLQREHARASRQQQRLAQLSSELQSLRAEIHAHR